MENKPEEHGSEEESVKLALASLFSDPNLQGGSSDANEGSLNVEDIPEKVRPILLDKWKRLRSNLDSSRPREPGEPARNAGIYLQFSFEDIALIKIHLIHRIFMQSIFL